MTYLSGRYCAHLFNAFYMLGGRKKMNYEEVKRKIISGGNG